MSQKLFVFSDGEISNVELKGVDTKYANKDETVESISHFGKKT